MRIVAWNCRMALARKRQHLYALQPDIAVIPECARPDLELCLHDGFDGRWFGNNPRKGLGVLVRKPLHISRTEKPPNRWIVPLSISGHQCAFRLIAVWAMPIKGSTVKSYIGQVYEAVFHHPQWFDGKPSILCGDFNSNKFWDGNRKTGNHSAVVTLLEKHSLISAYHHFFSETQGQETRPTYYFWHRKNRGYHIDYVFLPRDWASNVKTVEVGNHSAWSKLSDHVPLFVDVALPRAA
jgi:exonuclease III